MVKVGFLPHTYGYMGDLGDMWEISVQDEENYSNLSFMSSSKYSRTKSSSIQACEYHILPLALAFSKSVRSSLNLLISS